MVPQWLFGPAGDLRPLPPPDTDIGTGVERFGTKHKTLSGRRVVDSFGYLARYSFELGFLESDEYSWLEALYTHMIDGPFYLLDPLRKNLLSRYSASSRFTRYGEKGATAVDSFVDAERTYVPAPWTDRAYEWFSFGDAPSLHFDKDEHVPTQAGDTLTFSVLFWDTVGGRDVTPHINTFDANGSVGSLDGASTTLAADTWQTVVFTFTVPDSVTHVYPSVSVVTSTDDVIHVATPQVELGPEATAPQLGGGSPKVVVDSLDGTSPRFPYQSISMTLLEV